LRACILIKFRQRRPPTNQQLPTPHQNRTSPLVPASSASRRKREYNSHTLKTPGEEEVRLPGHQRMSESESSIPDDDSSSREDDADDNANANDINADNADISSEFYRMVEEQAQQQQQRQQRSSSSTTTTSTSTTVSQLQKRNTFLERELEKLLDDIDRYEAKLDEAEDEINQLLFQKKKLRLTLDNVGFRRTEFEAIRQELDESRDTIVRQQQLLDEQELQIEEQDHVVRGLEERLLKLCKEKDDDDNDDDNDNHDNHDDEPQQLLLFKRISDGRKSAFEIASAKRDMQIAMLQAELEETRKSINNTTTTNATTNPADESSSASLPELQKALRRIDALEKEKEESNATIAVLKDSVKELQAKLKKSEASNKQLDEKISMSSEKSHEWKRRAEAAEKQLLVGGRGTGRPTGTANGKAEDDAAAAAADEGDDAPQALLLQSALARRQENAGGWGLGAVFGNAAGRLAESPLTNHKGGLFNNNTGIFSSGQNNIGAATAVTTSNGGDDSDMECIKQINRSLKEDNKQLRKDLEKLEKAHKKEQSFNQKLIVKLQRDNDKLNRKIDGKSPGRQRPSTNKASSSSSSSSNPRKAVSMGFGK